MATQTEAACLFDTGALYGRRTLLRTASDDPVFVGIKPGAFSIYFGDAPIFHCDREGRWQRAYVDRLHYLKGLDGVVQVIARVREGANLVLHRGTLNEAETKVADARMRTTALSLLEALDAGRYDLSEAPPKGKPVESQELRGILETIARWDDDAWSAHVARYREAYGPLPFLTPDCPNPIILQGTVGGSVFGSGEVDTHVVRTPEEFERHAEAVATLLGRRIEQSKALFLGGSDVLLRPIEDVAAYLTTASRVFPIDPTGGHRHPDPTGESPHRLDGVHTFLDRFDAALPDAAGLLRLRKLGLTRVSLGIESGATEIRALSAKHWDEGVPRYFVSDLKAAGISVGLATLIGAGGADASAQHVAATAALLLGLGLGRGDLVMLLDARETAGMEPSAFSQAEYEAQRDELRSALATLREAGVKVVPYSLAKQGLS